MDQLVVRPAVDADAESARALIRELGYGGLDAQTFSRGFAAVLADSTQRAWVAEKDGQVVGLMSLSVRPQLRLGGSIVTIDEIVVTEHARGKGIGTRLLEFAKAEAARVGARRLELHTARRLPSYARGFYTRNGFTEIDSAVMRWEGGVSVVVR